LPNNGIEEAIRAETDRIRTALKDRVVRVVASSCNMHENTVYKILRGENVSIDTINKLSNYLFSER
jgi:predicted transcriptional regulator